MGFDILFLIICGIGFLAGYKRGIVYMVFFVAALFFGVFATLKFSYITSEFLYNQFGFDGAILPLVSLVLTFIIVFGLVIFLAQIITKALKVIFLNSINRLLGGALGALAAAALVSIGAWYVNGLNLIGEGFINNSTAYEYSMEFAPLLIEHAGKIIPTMGDLFDKLEVMFNVVKEGQSEGQ